MLVFCPPCQSLTIQPWCPSSPWRALQAVFREQLQSVPSAASEGRKGGPRSKQSATNARMSFCTEFSR